MSRPCVGHGIQDLAIVRRFTLNFLKQEKPNRYGISCKKKQTEWGNQYLFKVFTANQKIVVGRQG
jgi:hypothetical protein